MVMWSLLPFAVNAILNLSNKSPSPLPPKIGCDGEGRGAYSSGERLFAILDKGVGTYSRKKVPTLYPDPTLVLKCDCGRLGYKVTTF